MTRATQVDSFQGCEADLVICSLVRGGAAADNSAGGFLADPRRANVLLTRGAPPLPPLYAPLYARTTPGLCPLCARSMSKLASPMSA